MCWFLLVVRLIQKREAVQNLSSPYPDDISATTHSALITSLGHLHINKLSMQVSVVQRVKSVRQAAIAVQIDKCKVDSETVANDLDELKYVVSPIRGRVAG